MKPKYIDGFKTLTKENFPTELNAEINNLPDWYTGSILRIGPAKFEIGNIKLNHWFDGLGMIYKFERKDGSIYFSNAFIKSEQYSEDQNGKMANNTFGTLAPKNFLTKLVITIRRILGLAIEKAECNVNFMQAQNRLLAITEVTRAMEIDPSNLNTIGEYLFEDNVKGQVTCAHPQYDRQTGEQFNFTAEPGPSFTYTIFKLNNNASKRENLASFKSKDFFYSHSIFLTKNYVILYAGPIRAKISGFLFRSFNESLYYDHKADCEFICVHRATGEITRVKYNPFVFLHSVNAFEDNGKIFLDSVVYNEKTNPYDCFYFDIIDSGEMRVTTKLIRHTIDLGEQTCSEDIISNQTTEFPRINSNYALKDYGFIYASLLNENTPADFLNGLIKINVKSKSDQKLLLNEGEYASEPIFIKNPEGIDEDDGLIFMNIVDNSMDKTYIIFLDAKDLSIVFKAYLPVKIPFALHGIHIK